MLTYYKILQNNVSTCYHSRLQRNIERMKKIMALFSCSFAVLGLTLAFQAHPAVAATMNVQIHTPEEIRSYVKENTSDDTITYAVEPSTKTPYSAGRLSDATQQSALKMLNQMRYIAGIDANVTLDAKYCEEAQAATLVNAINGELSHYPEQPAGMDYPLYKLGLEGASSCNLGLGHGSLHSAIIHGWMNDGDSKNIDRIGHRRWILNPNMGKTGFGVTDAFFAVYAHDYSNNNTCYTNVTWPAQNMPLDYFGSSYPWSVSTGNREDENCVQVELTRESDQKVWRFGKNVSGSTFYVSNSGYGKSGCIIFRPQDVDYEDGDVFTVRITGLKDGELTYKVNFFDLCNHNYANKITQATMKRNGKIADRCLICGKIRSTSVIYRPQTIQLSCDSYEYNGKAKKPSVEVTATDGNVIPSSFYSVIYPKGCKKAGKYKIEIKFRDNYSGTVYKTFEITPKSTSLSSLRSKTGGFTVKWKKKKNNSMTGYQIQYATNKRFKGAKTKNIKKNSVTSLQIRGLKNKTHYYVRIRTYKKTTYERKSVNLYSGWSKVKHVKTK